MTDQVERTTVESVTHLAKLRTTCPWCGEATEFSIRWCLTGDYAHMDLSHKANWHRCDESVARYESVAE